VKATGREQIAMGETEGYFSAFRQFSRYEALNQGVLASVIEAYQVIFNRWFTVLITELISHETGYLVDKKESPLVREYH
jgi:hypothetical protein